jgi:hypothetical protein
MLVLCLSGLTKPIPLFEAFLPLGGIYLFHSELAAGAGCNKEDPYSYTISKIIKIYV